MNATWYKVHIDILTIRSVESYHIKRQLKNRPATEFTSFKKFIALFMKCNINDSSKEYGHKAIGTGAIVAFIVLLSPSFLAILVSKTLSAQSVGIVPAGAAKTNEKKLEAENADFSFPHDVLLSAGAAPNFCHLWPGTFPPTCHLPHRRT